MVKTRRQKEVSEKDEQRLKSIQPPRVCCTTPPPSAKKRPAPPPSMQSVSTRKKKLMFAPEPPQEFLFEFRSPPARRMLVHDRAVHDSVVRIEFEMRGAQNSPLVEIGEQERIKYREWVSTDLKKELKTLHGFDCDHVSDDIAALKSRVDLAETFRRRAELRRIGKSPLPNEMSLKELQIALGKRRISFINLTHSQASEALERALIKEDADGLIGEGYQFGRRMVSAADLISFWQPSDKEMREMLQQRAAEGVVIPRKKSEKLELLSKFVETEQEQLMRELVRAEMTREAQRRRFETIASHDPVVLFESIFSSGTWKHDYVDVDNTPLDPDEQSAKCVLM